MKKKRGTLKELLDDPETMRMAWQGVQFCRSMINRAKEATQKAAGKKPARITANNKK